VWLPWLRVSYELIECRIPRRAWFIILRVSPAVRPHPFTCSDGDDQVKCDRILSFFDISCFVTYSFSFRAALWDNKEALARNMRKRQERGSPAVHRLPCLVTPMPAQTASKAYWHAWLAPVSAIHWSTRPADPLRVLLVSRCDPPVLSCRVLVVFGAVSVTLSLAPSHGVLVTVLGLAHATHCNKHVRKRVRIRLLFAFSIHFVSSAFVTHLVANLVDDCSRIVNLPACLPICLPVCLRRTQATKLLS
jgi:ABC-type sugar transport system permease subunit